MPSLKAFTPDQIIKLLKKNGFVFIRQKGSHKIFVNEEQNLQIVVPYHKKDLPKGTCYSILKQAKII